MLTSVELHRQESPATVRCMIVTVSDTRTPNFGEVFRYLSFAEDIGSAAILSRAIAGVTISRSS
uniref:Uncharacterized protein n=1 Tax=Paenibacillus athensensis TaxID=1967502 RepID=A0A4Y8QAF3_9BACL